MKSSGKRLVLAHAYKRVAFTVLFGSAAAAALITS
jgi:hypothetical protein